MRTQGSTLAGTIAIWVLFFSFSSAYALAETTPCPHEWTHALKLNDRGGDVLALQKFLNLDSDTVVATTGPGSPSYETNRYGGKTADAVRRFQEKYRAEILEPQKLASGTGRVGEATRAKLNLLCAVANVSDQVSATASASPKGITIPDILTISDSGQPESSIAPNGAGVNFTTITLTAGNNNVTVRSVTVERVGMASDSAFATIALNGEDGLQIGNQLAFDSNHRAVFKTPFVVRAGTSQTLTVVGYMAADLTNYAGQTPILQISALDASSPIMGQLPLKGSVQIVNSSLVIGGATGMLSPLDPNGARNRYIGEHDVIFSAIRMTANSVEDVTLSYMIWNQSGTASASDMVNIVTIAGATSSPAIVQADGRTYISMFDPAVVIPKGQSIDVLVKGDLKTTGAGRTVQFDLFDNTDDEGTGGNTYGFGVPFVPSGNTAVSGNSVFITSDGTTDGTAGTPFFAGSVTTITGGTATYVGK